MDSNGFYMIWSKNLHDSPDQKKRLASAKSAKTTPDEIDPEKQAGVFPGSGKKPYVTSLTSCTCADFTRRHLPCKHIYRLAIELGLLNETAESGVNKNAFAAIQIPWKDAVAELEKMTEASQQTIQRFLYQEMDKKTEFAATVDSFGEELFTSPLVELIDAPLTALQAYRRKDITAVLDEHGVTGFKRNLSVKNLSAWCIENVPDVMKLFPDVRVFRFSDRFQKGHRKVYSYLLRKFAWDTVLDEESREFRVPHGAVFSDADPLVCYFPDDEITELLTLYGCNRCLNGYRANQNQSE